MELDLDSFLRSHPTDSDSDDCLSPSVRRTVDDILNDTDSDSSTSSPRSPSAPGNLSGVAPAPTQKIDRGASSISLPAEPEIAEEATAKFAEESKKTAPYGRRASGDFSGSVFSVPARGGNSRVLPQLLGILKVNPRPGAALAAAAAASRSVPTPHAAAIKFRRANGELSQKLGFTRELEDSAGDGDGEMEAQLDSVSDASGSLAAELGGKLRDNEEKLELSSNSGELEKSDIEEVSGREEEVYENLGECDDSSFHREAAIANEDDEAVGDATLDQSNSGEIDDIYEETDSLLLSNKNVVEVDATSASPSCIEDNVGIIDSENLTPMNDIFTTPVTEIHDFERNDPVENEDGGISLVMEDANSRSEANDFIEDLPVYIENYRKSGKRTGKRNRSLKKPLEIAEELEKRYASSGLHWEEGAAAQPMKLEGIQRGPPAVGYLQIDPNNAISQTIASQAFKRDHGTAQVLAVHMNFIALGMSKGFVLVMPSKYSAHYPDNMDSKMLMLGTSGEKSPVTSMCFNPQGDLLLAGYGDGHITVWDVLKATVLKTITGEHKAPIVHILFMGQETQVTRQFKAVTGDSKGHVLLHVFSVVPLLNRVTIKTQWLLDGHKTSTVLSASALVVDDYHGMGSTTVHSNATSAAGGLGGRVGGVVGGEAGWKLFGEGSSIIEEGVVVFVTNQTILVVRLTTLEKYAHLPRPEGVREGSMPYTAWKFRGYPRVSSNEPTTTEASDNGSLLAVAWDRKIQVYKFVKSEVKVYREWNLDNPAIGVAWLDDQMLVILTSRGQICLFAKDGIEIHRTSLIEHGGDEMVAYHTYFTNIFGNPEKAYHNSVAVRGATIYLLGPTNLVVSRLLPWKERIQVLQRAGDWMGALDMAMRLYDGHAHGVIDLPRTVEAIQDAIMPYLEELIISYVDEVFSYISLAFSSQTGKEQEDIQKTNSVQSESEDKYARVGGVAVEFCVHIKRIDILFDDIFSKFAAVKQGGTFLELLEPYILKDMLGCLPPEIMQALVEHYSNKGWLLRVEQCVLHMDISSLDFNQVVRLCREHGLHGALIYLFNRGLNDYRAPLEELLAVVINSHRKDAAPIGYRMLVYIKYCFSGLAFPPGHGTLAPSRLPSLRVELLQFLLEDSNVLNLQVGKSFKSLNGSCPNLSHLLWLDTEATLEVLRCAFTDDIMLQKVHSSNGLDDASTENAENNFQALEDLHIMVQNTVNTLIQVLDVQISEAISSSGTNVDELLEVWPSKKDIGHLLEFTSYFVSCKGARVSKGILNQILRYLTSDLDHLSSIASQNVEAARKREKEVLALLTVAPQTDWDSFHLLQLCEKAQFYQVCGFIHKMQGQYVDALDSYMKDVDEPIHAFAFISSKLLLLENSELLKFQTAVKDRIPQLISLSREGTLFLVFNHFSEERHHIFSTLQAFPKCLFFYLKTIIEVSLSGTLNFSCFGRAYAPDAPKVTGKPGEIEAYLEGLSKLPKLLQHNSVQLTDEMVELYLELLCQYERNSVLKFLETFENYRLEHCLRLCLDYEVTDAAAFLLERVGDVGNALSLIMSDLSKKLQFLDVALEKRTSETPSSFSEMEQLEDILRMEEVKNLLDLLHASISLCQRNAPRLDSHESESLWFRLLDWFCQPLRDLYDDKRKYSKGRKSGKVLIGTLDPKNENDTSMYRWKMSKFQKSAHILQRILSQFIREVIEGMVGYVPLPTIMSKLLSDNGCHEFGDFKLTILGMLGTYSFERRILDTAKSLIEDDTFYTMSLLKKGASHAYVPNSFVCSVCGSSLTKNSSKSSIRVFNCGHASHLQCEFGNGELSQDSNAECPICVPKKNRRSKSKAIPESGLIESHISRDPPATGTGILQNGHEFDTAEKPYGLQQMSRFEMLKNLGKSDRPLQTESVPLLRLAPPAIYHEKVKRATDLVRGESNYAPPVKHEQPSRMKAARDLRTKASSLHFPKKGSIFSDYINRKRGDM